MRQVLSIVVVATLVLGSVSAVAVTAQSAALLELLPPAEEIGPAFSVVESRTRTLAEQAAAFANPDEAARLLAEWEWQENAFKVFQAPTEGLPATLDISLTRFASGKGATLALPYFLEDRAAVLGQHEAPAASQLRIGEETRGVTGVVEGGLQDLTLYARSGPFLLRISDTGGSGSPHAAVEEIARRIIERATGQPEPVLVSQTVAAQLPDTLPLADAACFQVAGEGALDVQAVAARLAAGSALADALDALGWEGGSFRQFACDPPPGRTGWVDLSVHYFLDAGTAAAAVPAFAATRSRSTQLQPAPAPALGDSSAALYGPTVNGTEYTLYTSSGPLLFAVTGVAPAGDPQADVEQIATALLAATTAAPAAVAAAPTSTPYVVQVTVAPLPDPMPTPTATPLPPATVAPTPVPLPTATPLPTAPPLPTATPLPTQPPPPPTLIPVTVPTAAPQPTAASGPAPTPTPRVINVPDA